MSYTPRSVLACVLQEMNCAPRKRVPAGHTTHVVTPGSYILNKARSRCRSSARAWRRRRSASRAGAGAAARAARPVTCWLPRPLGACVSGRPPRLGSAARRRLARSRRRRPPSQRWRPRMLTRMTPPGLPRALPRRGSPAAAWQSSPLCNGCRHTRLEYARRCRGPMDLGLMLPVVSGRGSAP